MGMTQAEKVIKGLKCCAKSTGLCTGCPYDNGELIVCRTCDLAYDAIAVISEQQKRIEELEAAQTAKWMTLEYVRECLHDGDVVWLEDYDKREVIPGIRFCLINEGGDEAIEFHVMDGFIAARLAYYGKKWRCWTKRPTDEQREEIPWN